LSLPLSSSSPLPPSPPSPLPPGTCNEIREYNGGIGAGAKIRKRIFCVSGLKKINNIKILDTNRIGPETDLEGRTQEKKNTNKKNRYRFVLGIEERWREKKKGKKSGKKKREKKIFTYKINPTAVPPSIYERKCRKTATTNLPGGGK
jgi:hypothetical protein